MNQPEKTVYPGIVAVVLYVLVFSFLWLVFGDGSLSSWVVGAPVIVFAVLVSRYLAPLRVPRFNPFYLVVFFPVFLQLSMAGGVDVARRALSREVRLAPGLLEYSLRLDPGTPRVFFMLLITLLPGTLSADIDGDRLSVHVLDTGQENRAALASLEDKVARLFRVGGAGMQEKPQ
jgi:multicomponent Na+:H+ antiporter subunit E